MAPHSSTLAWKIPWMEEPGGLQSMGSLRVRHDWATSLSFSLSRIGEENGNPLQCSCLENPKDRKAWWASIYGVTQSRTRLKQLSSSSGLKQFISVCVAQEPGHREAECSDSGLKKLLLRFPLDWGLTWGLLWRICFQTLVIACTEFLVRFWIEILNFWLLIG